MIQYWRKYLTRSLKKKKIKQEEYRFRNALWILDLKISDRVLRGLKDLARQKGLTTKSSNSSIRHKYIFN